jgi:hypothetical protein
MSESSTIETIALAATRIRVISILPFLATRDGRLV